MPTVYSKIKALRPYRPFSFKIGHNSGYTTEEVIALKDKIIGDSIRDLKKLLRKWIKTYVPKRTGALQDSLIESIELWDRHDRHLEITTTAPYAFDTHDTRHAGTFFEHNGRLAYAHYASGQYYPMHNKNIFLNDPQAKDNWYYLLMKYAYEEFSKAMVINRIKYVGK